MSSHPTVDLLHRLPEGWSAVRYRGRRWGVSRTAQAGGRIEKLYAEELGGNGVISANLYVPGGAGQETDEQLRPCEMAVADVLDFLRGCEPLNPRMAQLHEAARIDDRARTGELSPQPPDRA